MDDDVHRLLVEYVERNGISVNLLIVRAHRKDTEWQVYEGKFGFLDTPLSLYNSIMGLL